jgi:phage terminase large subunit-like protein
MLVYSYDEYADDVLNNKIIACEAIKLACKRYKEWFYRDDMYFDRDDVERKIRIVSRLKHTTGKHNGKPFEMLPWQQFCVANIFGWKWKKDNLRVTRNVFIMISRKAGKTAFASAIGILCAIADSENNAEVELVANSRQQAKIAFDITSNFCESCDRNKKIFKRYRDSILIPKTKSKIQILSSDAMGNDGYNSSCFVLDEFHAAKNWDLYNVMKSSQGMREQPLAIIITTAGFLLNGYPCYEHRLNCIDILKGNKTDDTQFSAIYELDNDDDWQDENTWIKCSPSLGQTVSYDYLREQIVAAKNNSALEMGVRTKNFNQFCQTKNVWIPDKYLLNIFKQINIVELKDEDCYMGVDLSAISDLTATAIMFPPNPERKLYPDKYIFKNLIYVPESTFEESVNADLYKLWYRQQYIVITSGNVVDYDYILKDQLKIYNDTYLIGIYYDEWNATSWAIDATTEGLPLYPYSQAIGNFNRPTKTFELLIRQNKIVIDYNPVVRWCFNNAELKYDYNENCKPVKSGGNQDRKIDPLIAMIQALGGFLNKNMKGYSDGEVLSV